MRVPSGIQGFDNLIEGGFPSGKAYLIAGEPGTGKTIYCLQYLLEGAKRGEKGIYISIDEKPEHIIQDAESLGWDIKSFLNQGLIQILDVTHYFSTGIFGKEKGIDIKRISKDIFSYVNKFQAKRMAIDPISPVIFTQSKLPDIAEYIRNLVFSVEDNTNCTTLLTSYIPVGSDSLSQHGIEEFASSGIILLRLNKIENKYIRTILVRKMRSTKIELSEYSFEILPKRGIVLRQPI